MALSNYGELKTALANLLNRDDLTDYIPDFIKLCETDFDARPECARHRRRICRASASISSEYTGLPSNYLSIQTIRLDTSPKTKFEYVSPDLLERLVEQQEEWEANLAEDFGADPAPPKYYTIVGTELRVFPEPEETYTCKMTVFERLTSLSSATDDNWLLTYFPSVYLYGSALHAAPFLRDDERIDVWRSLYETAVAACAKSDPTATQNFPLRTEVADVLGGSAIRRLMF